ncbi:hypothetical protein Tco_1195961, partial [Tanacetum coccineum]
MNGWLEEDDDVNENVNNEDIEDEDVETEVDDDAELIFPYEVEGDQTSPPRDESSDSEPPNMESSDSESEDEEVDVAPEVDVASEATVGTSTQKPYVIRDFPRGLYEVEESSSARDSSYVGGLAPWALRRDLETSRARARLTEADLSTNQTEIALLKSKNKIGEKDKELLDHDLGDVERTLGNVLERLKVLESGENTTLKKRLTETETKLAWARMERDIPKPPSDDEDTERSRKKSKNSTSDGTEGPSEPSGPPRLVFWSCIALDGDMIMPPKEMSEARMCEVIREQVATSMAKFMANTNREAGGDRAVGAEAGGAGAGGARAGGARAGGAGASGAGASGAGAGSVGAGGAGAGGAGAGGAGPTAPEISGCTYVTFMKCDPQPFKGTEGAVGLCQWFEKLESVFRISDCKERDKVKFATATLQVVQRLEQELYNLKLKGTDIDGYTNRFHELALLCPRMVEPEQVKVEQYISGLSKNMRGDVTSSRPASIDEAVRMAYQLMGQIIQDKADEVSEGEKRKGEGDRGGRGDNRRDYNRRQNQRRANAGAMTNVAPNDNEIFPKCKNKKHNGDCWKCGKCGKLGHKTAAW